MILNLKPRLPTNFYLPFLTIIHTTWLRSAVGNVSGYRCESDCRSRGHKFDTVRSNTFVEIDHDIASPFGPNHSRRVVASNKRKNMHEVLAWKSLVRFTERPAMTIAVELGRKAIKKNYNP